MYYKASKDQRSFFNSAPGWCVLRSYGTLENVKFLLSNQNFEQFHENSLFLFRNRGFPVVVQNTLPEDEQLRTTSTTVSTPEPP